MYAVKDKNFTGYMAAVDVAKAIGAEVFEVREDGSKIRRWAPAAAVSTKKVRVYNERQAAYAAQEAQKNNG